MHNYVGRFGGRVWGYSNTESGNTVKKFIDCFRGLDHLLQAQTTQVAAAAARSKFDSDLSS